MVAGLLIYLWGGRYLPREAERGAPVVADRGRFDRATIVVLVAVALAVTVFRGAYEQIGNTVALWADTGVDRHVAGRIIPMTWFQALDPLLVMVMTPPLLAFWHRRAAAGHRPLATRRMATGAAIVAGAYLLLAAVAATSAGRAEWYWLVLFFVIYTLGELFVLPAGLGLFARLAPRGLGATTVAAWFLTIFSGSLFAGVVGTLWGRMGHASYFVLLAGLSLTAAALLRVSGGLLARAEPSKIYAEKR